MAPPSPRERAIFACMKPLVVYLRRRGVVDGELEDGAQEILILALYGGPEGGQRWDGTGDAMKHLYGVANNYLKAYRRKAKAEGPKESVDEVPASVNPQTLLQRRHQALSRDARREELDARFADDAIVRGWLELVDQGVSGEKEQAERLGTTVEKLRAGKKRFTYAAQKSAPVEEDAT